MKSDKQSAISATAAAKDQNAWGLRQQGLTYAAIGLLMGVGRERIRQRIAKHERRLKRLQEKQIANR